MSVERDNVRDHRAGTSDHPLQNHAQVRLRVHHIVIPRVNGLYSVLILRLCYVFWNQR